MRILERAHLTCCLRKDEDGERAPDETCLRFSLLLLLFVRHSSFLCSKACYRYSTHCFLAFTYPT